MQCVFDADVVGAPQAGQAGLLKLVFPHLGYLSELVIVDGFGVSPFLAEAIPAHALRCVQLLAGLYMFRRLRMSGSSRLLIRSCPDLTVADGMARKNGTYRIWRKIYSGFAEQHYSAFLLCRIAHSGENTG